MADVKGDVKGSKVYTGTRWVSIISFNGNKANNTKLDLEDCLFTGTDTSKNADGTPKVTYTIDTCTGVWHRDFSSTKRENDRDKDIADLTTKMEAAGNTTLTIALKSTALSPEAQAAIVAGMFAFANSLNTK